MKSKISNSLGRVLGPLSSLSAANVLDQSIDCVKLIGIAGDVQYMNANGLCAMEIDDLQSIVGRNWADLWPDEARHQIAASFDAAASGDTAHFRAFCPTAKSTPRWWDVSVSMVADRDGKHIGYLSVSRDVTEQHRSREALSVSAAELKHRLKNTYTMIGSMLTVFARGDAVNEAFAAMMRARLGAIGTAQSLFTGDASCEIETLIPALVEPFDNPGCRVVVEAPTAVSVDRGRADAIALVIGELAVNAAKHGALAHGGEIRVTTTVDTDRLNIIWVERSNVPPETQSREGGQGLALIQRIVAARQGRIETEWTSTGLTTSLNFPIL